MAERNIDFRSSVNFQPVISTNMALADGACDPHHGYPRQVIIIPSQLEFSSQGRFARPKPPRGLNVNDCHARGLLVIRTFEPPSRQKRHSERFGKRLGRGDKWHLKRSMTTLLVEIDCDGSAPRIRMKLVREEKNGTHGLCAGK